ncbi:MAG: type II secretion system protein [Eubacteriaceae bacterium]|nr:type II secretion system protein [Eubacteriaceae bacterium]
MLQKINNMMRNKKNKKGFTLVEVIVVLVILAILAAILVPSMIGWINKANKKTAVVEARSILLATQETVTENYKTYQDKATAELSAADEASALELAEVAGKADITASAIKNGKVDSFTYTTEDGKYTVKYTKAGGYSVE